jgi:hypothetical protein
LVIDLKKCQAILDRTVYPLDNPLCAEFLDALVAAKGDWLGPSNLEESHPNLAGARPDRLKKKLPDAIRNLVETKPAKGSRIALEKLA